MSRPRLIAAPLQGLTESAWRRAHAALAGGADEYRAPFARIDHGAIRPRDLREISSEANYGIPCMTVPQAIARDADEFCRIADAVAEAGHTRLDLNMGCPFPPQVKKGRGAGLIGRPEALAAIADAMKCRPSLSFSIKMRLGIDSPHQWHDIIDIVNAMPLCEVTVHPRTAVQQYGGELFTEAFSELLQAIGHQVVYNGDITSPSDITDILSRWPQLDGIMAGRGLIARPTLFAEWRNGTEADESSRLKSAFAVLDSLLDEYSSTLCGDTQILSKLKPYWDYLAPAIGHKTYKAIRKAVTLAKYRAALPVI